MHGGVWTCRRPSVVQQRLPALLDALELHEEVHTGGSFGIGLQVDPKTYGVLKVNNLIPRPGATIPELLSVGDTLLKINGAVLGQTGNTVERLIPGDFNTYVTLRFRDKETGQEFELDAMRHVPLQVWEKTVRRYEIREHLAGQDLCAEPRLVPVLEGIRDSVIDTSGDFVDLLHYWESDPHVSLGLVFAAETTGTTPRIPVGTVSRLMAGCPAAVMDLLRPGDEVRSVNGMELGSNNLAPLLNTAEVAARRKASLRISRQGTLLTVDVPCVSQGCSHALEQLVANLGALERLVVARADTDKLLEALRVVLESARRAACERIQADVRQAELLCQAQQRIADHVLEAEKLLRPICAATQVLEDLVPRVDLDAARADCQLHKADAACSRAEVDQLQGELQGNVPEEELVLCRAEAEGLRASLCSVLHDSISRTIHDAEVMTTTPHHPPSPALVTVARHFRMVRSMPARLRFSLAKLMPA